jgi:hypothetical protein
MRARSDEAFNAKGSIMRRLALVLFACLCGLARAAAQPPTPDFQINITQNCEVVVPTACNGGIQRFTISADGRWRATLRNGNPLSQGNIDRSTVSKLQSAVQQLIAPGVALPHPCEPRPLPPQTLEAISVELSGSTIVLYGSGGKIDPRCGGPGSPAERLFSAADSAMRKALAPK